MFKGAAYVIYLSPEFLYGVQISLITHLDLRQCMLGGIQCRLDSAVVRIRRIGMVVGECLSSRLDADGTQLKFEVWTDLASCREIRCGHSFVYVCFFLLLTGNAVLISCQKAGCRFLFPV